jgi:hypothetical protein
MLFFIVFCISASAEDWESSVEEVEPEEWESEEWEPGDEVSADIDNELDALVRRVVQGKFFDAASYGLEGNFVVVQEESGKLEPNGFVDRIRLIAQRKDDGIYDRELLFEITRPGSDPFLIRLPKDVKGFESRFTLGSFISAPKSEILLSVKGGRGAERFLIIEVRDKKGNVFYDSQTSKIPTVLGKFFNQYRAEILVRETGTRALIDLSPRKAAYDKKMVYHEATGTLRSPITIWRAGTAELQPIDSDGDGVQELKQVIELSGVGRADRVAYVESTLKYINEQWEVLESWIVPDEELANLPFPRRVN